MAKPTLFSYILFGFGFFYFILKVNSHGMMIEPPNRSSIWRIPEFRAYNATPNWSDNQIFCGGFQVQYEQNRGLCGVCGDAYNDLERPNEDGGIYDSGITVRKYKSGQVIPIAVNLTQTHWGYFELRLCAQNDISSHLSESCYNKHVLEIHNYSRKLVSTTESTTNTTTISPSTKKPRKPTKRPSPPKRERNTKYYVDSEKHTELHEFEVRLPRGIKCRRCVLQWEYRTGQRWGYCNGNRYARGCGPQETYRNCADIAIF